MIAFVLWVLGAVMTYLLIDRAKQDGSAPDILKGIDQIAQVIISLIWVVIPIGLLIKRKNGKA